MGCSESWRISARAFGGTNAVSLYATYFLHGRPSAAVMSAHYSVLLVASNNIFLAHQISTIHQSASSTFFSQQINTSHSQQNRVRRSSSMLFANSVNSHTSFRDILCNFVAVCPLTPYVKAPAPLFSFPAYFFFYSFLYFSYGVDSVRLDRRIAECRTSKSRSAPACIETSRD